MQTNPRIGIIGGGAIGRALVAHLTASGIETLVTSARPQEDLAQALSGLGPLVRAATFENVACQEVVFLAVPWSSVGNVLGKVVDWEARVLIDATNATRADGTSTLEKDGKSSSELVAELAPGAHVVKAFNTLPAAVLAQPPAIGVARRVIFYASDHQRARRQVGRLISAIGFSGISLGGLATGGQLLQPPDGALSTASLLQLPG